MIRAVMEFVVGLFELCVFVYASAHNAPMWSQALLLCTGVFLTAVSAAKIEDRLP